MVTTISILLHLFIVTSARLRSRCDVWLPLKASLQTVGYNNMSCMQYMQLPRVAACFRFLAQWHSAAAAAVSCSFTGGHLGAYGSYCGHACLLLQVSLPLAQQSHQRLLRLLRFGGACCSLLLLLLCQRLLHQQHLLLQQLLQLLSCLHDCHIRSRHSGRSSSSSWTRLRLWPCRTAACNLRGCQRTAPEALPAPALRCSACLRS